MNSNALATISTGAFAYKSSTSIFDEGRSIFSKLGTSDSITLSGVESCFNSAIQPIALKSYLLDKDLRNDLTLTNSYNEDNESESVSEDGDSRDKINIDNKIPKWLKDLIIGTGYSLDDNMLFNAGFSIAGLSEKDLSNSKCENLGRVIGDLISLLGGGTEMAAGVGGEGIGFTLDATGGGAIAGVPINIASGAVVLGGGIVLKRSAGNLGDDLMSLIKGGNGENVKGTAYAEKILGKNGAQFESKTTWQNGKTERIDVENPSPGERSGQIHYHEPDNTKWYFDVEEKQFYNQKTGELAPNRIQKLLKDKDVINAINKALKFLGEDKLK
jgi:hypothetical protein